VLNVSVGVMQIVGFAAGGLLIAVVSPRTALVIGAALSLTGALVFRFGLARRQPRALGRPSVRATWRVNRHLWSSPARRSVYLALWVPNGLVVGCEALFVPYAPDAAGVLFIAGALGMLAGDLAVGRFVPHHLRPRLVTPLRVLLALPYLLFALPLGIGVAAAAALIASVGFGAGLLLQERLIALTGEDVRGQALGLHSTGMMTMQGVGATVAGLVAQYLPVGTAMTVMAAASLVVSLLLTSGLRMSDPRRALADVR
jgi:predicted MFS family arabinose efflux permease